VGRESAEGETDPTGGEPEPRPPGDQAARRHQPAGGRRRGRYV